MDLTIHPTTTHHTFSIHRTYPTPPERVFSAFSDPAKKRRWFVEAGGHAVEEFTMDFRAGGSERARFRLTAGPLKGSVLTNDARYQDIVPNRRIVTASTMAFGDQPFSASLATFEFLPTDKGTDLIFTHQGAFFEGADGAEMRQQGWRKLLEELATELA